MNNDKYTEKMDCFNKVSYPITVIGRNAITPIECGEHENLLEAMTRQGIYMNSFCGGQGTCGKCRIKLIEGELVITSADRMKLSNEDINEGFRLSCTAYPSCACTIKLITSDETDFEVVTDFQTWHRSKNGKQDNYAIAVDLGTTTIAISLVEVPGGSILWTYTVINKQRAYGADVISRIQASNSGKMAELKESIQKDLVAGIQNVIEKTQISKSDIIKIVIAGNTTMGHLLLGYSCRSMGVYPFTPVNIDRIILPFKEVMNCDHLDVPVILLPGISAFVGGDITAGLFACDFDKEEETCLFIDLGTNGEMAVGNKDRILVSSTAAGPAFEGSDISCGVGSVAGAISNVKIEDGKLSYRTIGDAAPIGICGTGVIELTNELIKEGLVDETGLLIEPYFESGYQLAVDEAGNAITFTQKDIREIQLAKAAIRAGIELLLRRYGISYDEIGTVYLAGGFGYRIKTEKAVGIGLLPKELSARIKAIGNSSLGGAVKYLMEDNAFHRMEQIIKVSSEINLSNEEDFNNLYIRYMSFGYEA